jgi:AmiR/NasT family two-component response regulator
MGYVAECARCAQLQRALETRDVIATAKGVLMERFSVTSDEAFAIMVRVSQTSNTKMVDLCQRVVTAHDEECRNAPPKPPC